VRFSRANLGDLTPDEIERLAQEHLNGMVAEIRAATSEVRARAHPVNIAKKHPLAVAALAGAAAFLLVRLLSSTPRASAAPPPPGGETPQRPAGRTLGGTLLAGIGVAAGRMLPSLIRWWLTGRAI
jgi:hypothetical protein